MITVLTSNESGADSLVDINANFADLDTTKADLASPTFTGTPSLPTGTTAVTQSQGNNSTKIATTAYVDLAAAPPVISISTSSTPSIVTTAGQTLTIIAKGIYSTTGTNDANVTVNMKNNGATVDSCTVKAEASSAGGTANTVVFMYSAVPGAQTNAITFDQTLTEIQVISIIQS